MTLQPMRTSRAGHQHGVHSFVTVYQHGAEGGAAAPFRAIVEWMIGRYAARWTVAVAGFPAATGDDDMVSVDLRLDGQRVIVYWEHATGGIDLYSDFPTLIEAMADLTAGELPAIGAR